jgi:pyruvate dehydrogenase E1 component alpha subunit
VTAYSVSDLDTGVARGLLGDMIRIRELEERCAQLYGETKIRGFLHLYIGEEAVAAGVMSCLEPHDAVMATYREHGHALLRGISARSIMAEMFGKAEGCSGGRGGSMHLFDSETRFFGGNAIVGGHLPVAVGLGLASQMQHSDAVTACFFGEGAMAEGEFHEALNLAALWAAPVLFCCENNRYAMGTSLETSESATNLALKASSYQLSAWTVDGMDVVAVRDAAQRAITSIRAGGGPVFLELQTYRFRAHSMFDPDKYRPPDEVAQWRKKDPIVTFGERLVAGGVLSLDDIATLHALAVAEVDAAVDYAESGSLEPIEAMFDHVHSMPGATQ